MASAAPKRTHNNESANDTVKTRRLWSRNQGETVEMGIVNANAIYAMLSDLSSTPGQYVLREAQSNAYDATMRTGKLPATIEIWLPQEGAVIEDIGIAAQLGNADASTDTLTVIDHGCGMSYEEVCQNYLQYGGSDKTDELDSIGSKGLGAKAPLAIADSFDVTTTKDGITTHAHITKRPRSAGMADVYSKHTGRESGTTVVVPIASSTLLNQMWQFIHSLKGFSAGITLMVNGKPIEPKLPTITGKNSDEYVCLGLIDVATDPPCQMRAWQRYAHDYYGTYSYKTFPKKCDGADDWTSVSALVGGVLYPLGRDAESPSFIVEVDPGWLDFTPSRDEVKKCESTERFAAALKDALANVDMATILEAHIMAADTRTLALIRSHSEFGDPPKKARNRLVSPKDVFRFFLDMLGTPHIQYKGRAYPLSKYAYDRVHGCTIDADTIIISSDGAKRPTMTINGKESPKSSATEYIGLRDQAHNMRAIVDSGTAVNVIRDVRCRDDAAWVIRNETILRSLGAIQWDGKRTSIILVDDPGKIDPDIRELISNVRTMTLASAKAKVSAENAARRAELKRERETAKKQPITQQSWAKNLVTTLEIRRDAPEEELVLWMVDESKSRLPKIQEDVWLNTLNVTPNELAVIIVDDLNDRFSNPHNAACAFLLAMRKDPACVPDDVRYLVIADAKHFLARDFNTMIENGAFLVADRRSKLKSVRTDGLADKRPDLIEISPGLDVAADVSGISDHLLLARLIEFMHSISGDNIEHCDAKAIRLATQALDESLLTGDALAATRNVRELFSQYKVNINHRAYSRSNDACPITLCGYDIHSDDLYGYWRRSYQNVQLHAKGVPKDVLQMLKDASQMSKWFNGLLSEFGLSMPQYDVCVTVKFATRLRTFSAAISADMLAHFTREIV